MRFANGPAKIFVLFLAAMGIQAPSIAATFTVTASDIHAVKERSGLVMP